MTDYKQVLATQLDDTLIALNLTDYEIIVDNEVAFYTHEKTLDPKKIFVVIKELSGANVYNTFVVPCELHIFSEENSVEVTKKILDYYCKTYNLSLFTSGFDTIQTILETPEIDANFYNVGAGFRSMFEVEATFLIYQNVLEVSSIVVDGEEQELVNLALAYSGAVDTKSFADERLQKSVVSNGARGLSLITPAKYTALFQKALAIHEGSLSVNSDFSITITFRNGYTYTGTYKLSSIDFGKEYGELPALSFEFVK